MLEESLLRREDGLRIREKNFWTKLSLRIKGLRVGLKDQMARYKSKVRKQRLAKAAKQTRWAPFWIIFKALGRGKKVHPSRLTSVKRTWRRGKIGL